VARERRAIVKIVLALAREARWTRARGLRGDEFRGIRELDLTTFFSTTTEVPDA